MSLIPMSLVREHNTEESLWTVIGDTVYSLGDFLQHHPGGPLPLRDCAGKDGTKIFNSVHGMGVLKTLGPDAKVGPIDPKTITEKDVAVLSAIPAAPSSSEFKIPPIEHCLNIYDFEYIASKVMKKDGWDYYCSGADDEITLRENHHAFQRIWFKPRVLVNVKNIDMSTNILGFKSSIPVYITATALGKLAHPDGEVAMTRAAHNQGIIQMIPTLASCSFEEMVGAREPDQIQFYQLYVNPDRKVTEEIIRKVEAGGCRALCVTVDAPMLGKREKDMRNKFLAQPPDFYAKKSKSMVKNQGTARAISKFIDPSLNWDDIKWLKSITKLPIVLKGIQCAEDAVIAAQYGVQAIIISNHGGRQLDFSRSAIEILPEVISALRKNNIPTSSKHGGMEVWIDGGIRRGTDIFKALALGATCVGVGRPTLYGLASYGQEGIEKVIQIFKEELEMTMAMMGCSSIGEIKEEMLIFKNLDHHTNGMPKDYLTEETYIKLKPGSKL